MERDELLQTLKRQYDSTFQMLRRAVEICPDDLWEDRGEEAPFWQQALHTAMALHGSLREALPDFDHSVHQGLEADLPTETPPEMSFRARAMLGIQMMRQDFEPSRPVTREEMTGYLCELWERTHEALERDLDRGLGASHLQVWAGQNLLEKHIYYLRHTQHHIGRLNSILFRRVGEPNPWIVVEKPAFTPGDYRGIEPLSASSPGEDEG